MATIKFWQEMQRVVTIDGQDKLMIGKNSTGEAQYVNVEDLNQFLSIQGDSIPAITGGSTPATATVLPTLGDENRYFDASWGYWKYNNVVLNNPNGAQGIPDGSEGVLFWNGTTQTWSISKVQVLPKGKDGKTIEPFNISKVGGYIAGDQVYFGKNKIYTALVNVPIGESPESNPAKWKLEFEGVDAKVSNDINLIDWDLNLEGGYIITAGGVKTTITSGRTSEVLKLKITEPGKYFIGGAINYAGLSYYRLEKENGDLISGNLLSALPSDVNSKGKILTITEPSFFYFNIYYSTSPTQVQNKSALYIVKGDKEVFNPNGVVTEVAALLLRQYTPFRLGEPYKKGTQVSYQESVYNVTSNTDGSQSPTDKNFFAIDVGVKIDTLISKKNIFDKNVDIITNYYLNGAELVPNTSNIISILLKKTFTQDDIGFYSVNQIASGAPFYRIEDLNGALITGGTMSTISDSGIGRKFNITQASVVYITLYFRNTNNNNQASVPDINTYQLERGSSSTEFEPHVYIDKINGINIPKAVPSKAAKSRYEGLEFILAGDSLTAGGHGGNYAEQISSVLGCIIINKGSSGASTGRLTAMLTDIKTRSDTGTWITPDYKSVAGISIMIGTNPDAVVGSMADIPSGNVYGNVGTELDYFRTFTNSFYGNMGIIIEFIKWKNPETVIHLVSPPYGGGQNADLVSQRMSEIASYYSINFIDSTHESGLSKKYLSVYTYDGTHLTVLGNKVFGQFLAYKLK